MKVRSVTTIGVVLLVVLAGCSSLPLVGDENNANATDDASKKIEYPPGYNASGISDPKKAAEQHLTALSKKDSYTYEIGVNSGERITANVTQKTDVKNQRALATMNASTNYGSFILDMYLANDKSYQQISMFGMSRYNVSNQTFDSFVQNSTGTESVMNLLKNTSFGDAERVTRDGEQFFRYTATGNGSMNESAILGTSDALGQSGERTIEDLNATLLVDEDGIIRSLEYQINYTSSKRGKQSMTLTMQTKNIDSTTIKEPSWLDTAKQQANNSSGLGLGGNTSFPSTGITTIEVGV